MEPKPKTDETRGSKAIWGNKEHKKNQDFDFWEQGKMSIFFQENKGTGTPHTPPTPLPPLREPLFSFQKKVRNLLDIVQLTC